MFKTILVPTDGSPLSEKAVDAAVEFARANGGKIVGICVAEPYPFQPLAEAGMTSDPVMYEQNMRGLASRHVQQIAAAAKAAQVPCTTLVEQSFNPYEEIIKAAAQQHCDVIFMASHGRKGIRQFLIGSETQKVLAHSSIPVLVFR